jgi:hypothetical protein
VPKIHADPTQPSPAQETCVSFVFLLHCFSHRRHRESKERIICCPWLRASEAAVGGQEGNAKRCYAEGGGPMPATQQRQVTARNKNVTWLRAVLNKHRYEWRRLNNSHTTAASDCTKQKCDLAESRMKQAQIRVLVLVLVLVLGTALCSLIASCKRVQIVRYSGVLHAIAAS